jgi:hypothetical protein
MHPERGCQGGYIANHEEHHRKKTLPEELVEMLERAGSSMTLASWTECYRIDAESCCDPSRVDVFVLMHAGG